MKTGLFLLLAVATISLSSCKKDLPPDLATDWTGTYNGTAGNNTFNRVVVMKVNNSTVRMELQTLFLGNYVTYATIANAKVSSSSSVSIDESGTVAGYSGTYRFSGGGNLNGNTLTLAGQATQPNAQTLYYTFVGTK